MEHLYKAYDMLDNKLEEITKSGNINASGLEVIDKLSHAMKSIKTIIAMEEADSDYSEDDGSYRGSSYARGRGRNARRDSMGRYSRDDGSSYRPYERGGRRSYRGYSGEDKEVMVSQLEQMMNESSDEQTRNAIRQAINALGM